MYLSGGTKKRLAVSSDAQPESAQAANAAIRDRTVSERVIAMQLLHKFGIAVVRMERYFRGF
jgi:hypothetical protein